MAQSEWIARRTMWGSLGPVSAVEEPTGPPASTELPSAGCAVDARDSRDAVDRLFRARVINDGTGMIRLDVPHIVTREAQVPVSVQVNWSLVLANAVARLYLVADGNQDRLLACLPLIPDVVPPHLSVNVRLEDTGDVRAVVVCGDGTLLQVKRWVWVMPPEVEAACRGFDNPLQ
jgi:predicted secreted protein